MALISDSRDTKTAMAFDNAAKSDTMKIESTHVDPSEPSTIDPDDQHNNPNLYPEGGLEGWLVLAGTFFFLMCTYGWINLLGNFQEFYQENYLSHYTPSNLLDRVAGIVYHARRRNCRWSYLRRLWCSVVTDYGNDCACLWTHDGITLDEILSNHSRTRRL